MNTVWICDYVRTPVGRYGGGLAGIRTDDLAALPLSELLRRHEGLSAKVDEVFLGCANQAGEDNRNVARMAALLAGLPDAVPAITLNRLCASGMDAVGSASRAIALGEIEVALAGGVESMSRSPLVMAKPRAAFQRDLQLEDTTLGWRFVNPAMQDSYGTDSLPETGENVARDYKISREDQDAFALRSQQRTAQAEADGILAEERMSVEIPTGKKNESPKKLELDEHPRPETTAVALAKLRPIVCPGGTVTAGNATGINDGAAALLLATPVAARRMGLQPLACITGTASAGVAPRIMGMGPVPAVGKLLARLGWSLPGIDVIELNEAFASQALACLREWGLPDDASQVNPNGGAIALGHPLGMSGVRIVGAAARELARRKKGRAIATMCVGVGQGVALALESAK